MALALALALPAANAAPRAAYPVVSLGPLKIRAESNGRFGVRVGCPKRARACIGKLQVWLGSRMLGSKAFSLRHGAHTIVRFKLGRATLRSLRKKHKLKILLIAYTRDGHGKSASTTRTVTLLAPKR